MGQRGREHERAGNPEREARARRAGVRREPLAQAEEHERDHERGAQAVLDPKPQHRRDDGDERVADAGGGTPHGERDERRAESPRDHRHPEPVVTQQRIHGP